MNKRTLNCFYDLSIAPCSYDFFAFLISAELHRIRNKFSSLAVVFLPGPNNGYRQDNLRTFQQNDNFFKNVLLNAPLLYQSCSSIVWLNSRVEALNYLQNPDNIFPRGYSLDNSITDYLYHGIVASYFRGDQPVFFQSPDYARDLAKSLFGKIASDRRFITLTTRELLRDDPGTRRIDINFWESFFSGLDKSKFQPLIIRDTSVAVCSEPLFKNVPEIPAASIHLHMRYAIYQESFLNIFKPNGPSILSSYGTTPNLFFFEANNNLCAISNDWYQTHYGMSTGSQFPLTTKNKRLIWGKENLTAIEQTISLLETSEEDLGLQRYPITDSDTLRYTTKVALMHTLQNLRYGVLEEDVQVLRVYKDLLLKGLVSGPQPNELIEDHEAKNIFSKNTWDKIMHFDAISKSILGEKSKVYQVG